MTGVGTRPAETMLTARAQDFLAAGPADSVTLVTTVCQMSGVPAVVAEHMAVALFAGRTDFVRDGDGRWTLVPKRPGGHAPTAPELLASLPYVVVDVETTGGRAFSGDRITEVAAYVVEGGVVTNRFESLINPERSIPPMISALTNITWSMVKTAPRFRDVCEELLRVLEGRVFVAHNAEFDWRFIRAEVQRATGRLLHGRRLCTVRLARRVLPQLRSRRLDSVAYHYGVEILGRHRAGGDAMATARILLRLLADARERECYCWADLQRLLGARARGRRPRRPLAMPQPVRSDPTT